MPGLGLTLLGDFQARIGCGPLIAIGAKKNRALLAYLAVAGPRAHPRDTLCALLWGEVPEDQSRQSLRKALCELRQALAGATPSPLSADGDTVTLVPETVDVLEFQALVRDGRPDALRGAMELYRGNLLQSLRVDEPAFEEWLTLQRERLRRLSVETLERLVTLDAAGGRVGEAVEVALRLLALNPAHELAHRSLIR